MLGGYRFRKDMTECQEELKSGNLMRKEAPKIYL
jgi:hypothetical protein